MTLEQALIYGIGGLSTALTWAVTKLWGKPEGGVVQCAGANGGNGGAGAAIIETYW